MSFYYFGHFESADSEKSTFGKRLFTIRVVEANGNKPNFLKAGLRATFINLLAFAFALVGVLIGALLPPTLNDSKPLILIGVGLGNIWHALALTDLLFLVWSTQKQRLIDVLFKTYVINDSHKQTAIEPQTLSTSQIITWCAIALAVWSVFFYIFSGLVRSQ